jgi:hypothetical protein
MIEDDPPFKGEYVDYQPIDDTDDTGYDDRDRPEREPRNDNPTNFDY